VGCWEVSLCFPFSRVGGRGRRDIARRVRMLTCVVSPVFLAVIAQLAGGGVFVPIYYGVYLFSTRSLGRQTTPQRRVDLKDAIIYLPLLFAFHYGPVLGIMYHPSFEGRHYWTWFWQLYPLRITITYYIVCFLFTYLPLPKLDLGKRLTYHQTITLLLAPLIALSAAAWIHTLIYSPYPLQTVFWPQPLMVDTWMGRLRRILQFDYLFVNGTSLLWASALLRDAGIVDFGGMMKMCISTVGLTVALGPAAALGVLWVWREGVVCGEVRRRKGE
jgi:hypothetical protein